MNWGDIVGDLWVSKKFRTALLGSIVGLAGRLGLSLDVESLALIISPFIAAIVGQGIADLGKERVIAEAAVKASQKVAEDHAHGS